MLTRNKGTIKKVRLNGILGNDDTNISGRQSSKSHNLITRKPQQRLDATTRNRARDGRRTIVKDRQVRQSQAWAPNLPAARSMAGRALYKCGSAMFTLTSC